MGPIADVRCLFGSDNGARLFGSDNETGTPIPESRFVILDD